MRTEKWYQRRLAKYFTDYFGVYEDTAEFFPDSAINQWLFYIPELGMKIKLTCDDEGKVTEQNILTRKRNGIPLRMRVEGSKET